ncbi:hypothetical protein BAE44_0010029 [Dichanthelium oligosanthes]|uniref:Uncharacterized protein n=1 Tax=Dichanthelium oligosanthes TaxID=888268 RepID=A0A1E5VV34_9POAL|nr:hypothetical protein BAE44_0010029 [Dichanthelium oligosanthes]
MREHLNLLFGIFLGSTILGLLSGLCCTMGWRSRDAQIRRRMAAAAAANANTGGAPPCRCCVS